jgi:CheY-like chemotaxis protein
MNEILFMGNVNSTFNKDIIKVLKQEFYLQIFNGKKPAFDLLMEVSRPDLVFVSCVEPTDELRGMLYYIKHHYSSVMVLTLGTKLETKKIMDLYQTPQFENIDRPAEDSFILSECSRAMEIGKLLVENEADVEGEEVAEQKRKNVLIVDDSQIVLRNIKAILDKRYDVSMAISGSKALMILGKKNIDLILLDYDMPVMDGKQVFKLLKANPDCSDIPIIFLTGVSSNEKVLDILGLKPDGYILKPPDADNILSRIEEIIGR